MRWKNRIVKFTMEIPAECPSDEEFALDLADVLDSNKWTMVVVDDVNAPRAAISKVVIGDIEIEPED